MSASLNNHATNSDKTPQPETTNGAGTNPLAQIHEALTVVHSPYSSNESRKQASAFLEQIKADEAAPYHGYTLACDRTQEAVVRHYALSLLEYAIKHRWSEYSEAQATALRGWILQLAENISRDDPLYIRTKTAQLWVEIAKRSWADQWLDMDELLVKLWNVPGSVVHKEFVLFILENLSDEVFNGEDAAVAMREAALSKACVEIFTPAKTLVEAFPDRQVGVGVRYGEEGWLVRLAETLGQCMDNDVYNNEQYRSCALKTLAVFKSIMPWAIPRAISAAGCVAQICKSLAAPSVAVQMVCSNSPFLQIYAHNIRHRSKHSTHCIVALISQMRSFSP
jgi:exportin-5